MNFPDLTDSATPEFGSFVTALKEVFHGEPWEDIATYAERAWRACGLGEDTPWTDVEHRIRDAWGEPRK